MAAKGDCARDGIQHAASSAPSARRATARDEWSAVGYGLPHPGDISVRYGPEGRVPPQVGGQVESLTPIIRGVHGPTNACETLLVLHVG